MWDRVVSSLERLERDRRALLARQRQREAQWAAFDAWATSASQGAVAAIRAILEGCVPEIARATGAEVRVAPRRSKAARRSSHGVESVSVTLDPCTVRIYAARSSGELPQVRLEATARRGGRQEAVVSYPVCCIESARSGFELRAGETPVTAEQVALEALTLLVDACQSRLRLTGRVREVG